MTLYRIAGCFWCVLGLLRAAGEPSAASLANEFRSISIDADQTYRVRDLHLSRGDISIYLTEGTLAFAKPIAGRIVAAVFTTAASEAGDAEVIVMPPQRSERASLASYINSPNLDEHFGSVIFFFSDDTAKELTRQIDSSPTHKTPELAPELAKSFNPLLESVSSQLLVRLIEALLDAHQAPQGFFCSLIAGSSIGPFDVIYEPSDFEPISIGRVASDARGQSYFQLWTSFRPRQAAEYKRPPVKIRRYQIEATIHPDLSMSVDADLAITAGEDEGRVLPFGFSDRLTVDSATLDGEPVEVFQRGSARLAELKSAGTFLLVSNTTLPPGSQHSLRVHYEGSVIRKTEDATYFVDDRNAWYPYSGPTLASFDLTFHCPQNLRLVATGEPIAEEVENGIRTVHRRTPIPERLAGFNLGDYDLSAEDHEPYRVECYGNRAASLTAEHAQFRSENAVRDVSRATESILDAYTRKWVPLPIHSLAVSPIPGYFGQGFPGLIYLSTIAYLRPEDRPARLRNERLDAFFSELLLPHEIAHQWWGNMVNSADYRSSWLMEAMANYSALEFLRNSIGPTAVDSILAQYRDDLTAVENGKALESAGPVDFGARLLETTNLITWRTIIYEKGTWILHMLRSRLGEDGFNRMEVAMLKEFADKPVRNEDFRKLASQFVPAGQPDKTLESFFDTWVYGTGLPRISMSRQGGTTNIGVTGVSDDFTADVPLVCRSRQGRDRVQWVRVAAGQNPIADPVGSCALPPSTEYLYIP